VIRKQGLEDVKTDTALQSTILEAHYYITAIFKDNIGSIQLAKWFATRSTSLACADLPKD